MSEFASDIRQTNVCFGQFDSNKCLSGTSDKQMSVFESNKYSRLNWTIDPHVLSTKSTKFITFQSSSVS